MSGFSLTETLTGSYRLFGAATAAGEEARERPIVLTLGASSGPLLRFLGRPAFEAAGEIDAEGFASHRPVLGHIVLARHHGYTLDYSFSFTADDGAPYRLAGRRSLRLRAGPGSLTLLPIDIQHEPGALAGRALLRLDPRTDLPALLQSLRVAL